MSDRKEDGIKRRDFLNGMMIAAGGAAVASSMPFKLFAAPQCGTNGPSDGAIGDDPRVLRGGNLRSVFTIGHWLRDDRMSFNATSIDVCKSTVDNYSGRFPIYDDNGSYDVIVVGAGMSAASAAYFITKQRPGTKVLLLDGQATPGGNCNRDDAAPIPDISSTATAYAVPPYNDFLTDIYTTCGINADAHIVPGPFYSYFFDGNTPYVNPGTRCWNIDTYGAGLGSVPYPANIVKDLVAARKDIVSWYNTKGSPTDPADTSDPKYDYLAPMSFDYYLSTVKGFHPAVSDFYTRYAVDALAGTTAQVSAYTSISFLGAEYFPLFAFPGGNSGMLRRIVKHLVPGALDGTSDDDVIASAWNMAALDVPGNPVRIRQGCMVVRGDNPTPSTASVTYFNIAQGRFYRATAKAVIFAGQAHTARTCCEHLFSQQQADAYDQIVLGPVVVANVTLKSAASIVDLGYDFYWWGSQYWADAVVADWVKPDRNNPDRKTVLTIYGGNTAPPEEMGRERFKLLTTPFSSYEDSLRSDLSRILGGRGFDWDRDVEAVYLYRWGHSMVFPTPGFPFGAPTGNNGHVVRTPSARHIARQQVGRISFGGQDTESSPAQESAVGSGFRTAAEVLPLL